MINLYDYQKEAIDNIKGHLKEGKKRILIQSPTGSGKTIEFSHIVSEMKKRGKRALIITDRIELLFETGSTLEDFGLNPYHILAGHMVEPPMGFQVYAAMSQTLRRRIETWPNFWNSFDVVIVDECHKCEFNPYFENEVFPKSTIILGFSATPIRSGKQRQLSEDFQVMIEGLQVPELVKRKKLVVDHYYSTSAPDLDHAKYNSKGDYAEGWMFDKFNKTEIYEGVVENWKKICPNSNTLVFCINIQHTLETCRKFNESGIPAKFVVSDVAKPMLQANPTEAQRVRFEIKQKEYDNYIDAYQKYSGSRKSVIRQWKENKFKVLCNAGILTTGFNRKDIETIVLNRATTSLALYLQMIGRGSRIYPGKEYFNILDFGANGERLGYYNQERKWSLTHDQKKSEGATPVKECGKDNNNKEDKDKVPDINGRLGCGAYVFVSADICPYCGYVFKKEKQKKFAELIKIDYLDSHFPVKNTQIDEFQNLERTAEQRGYKQGWVIPQIIAKHGEDGLKEYAKYRRKTEPDKFGNGWIWQTKKRFQKLIDNYNSKS
jgi:superfamily II DNA or RNA helicase